MGNQIILKRFKDVELDVKIVGVTGLISHRWSAKARRELEDGPDKTALKGKKKSRTKAEKENEAKEGLYMMPDGGIGFPAVAFKAATIGGARFFEEVTLVTLKQCIYIVGEGPDDLVSIRAKKKLRFRSDIVRIGQGQTSPRYRYEAWPWEAVLTIRYPEHMLTAETVIALVDAGGRGGVGEWRPSSPKSFTGHYGQFRVA